MRSVLIEIAGVLAAAFGLGIGYLLWGTPMNWYGANVSKLGPGPENDLIRYGKELIVSTPRYIGKSALDQAMRYAGNDLACQNCHLNAGLQPYAAPFVSTFATFPMMVDDQVLTLTERINGCMTRNMNGKDLADDSRELEALIAYFKFVGNGSPEGVRVAGMGLMPIKLPAAPPNSRRGAAVYAKHCASCHGDDGQGEPRESPGIGYSIPPLWGDASFNASAGMAKTAYAASYIRSNMPFDIDYRDPVLTVQQAWDVAAYMISKPRPVAQPLPAPPPPAAPPEGQAPEAQPEPQ
ncbi:MAG: c-type cytochrome [Methyloceanibacter sp.]